MKKSHDAIIKQPIADRHNFVYIFFITYSVLN